MTNKKRGIKINIKLRFIFKGELKYVEICGLPKTVMLNTLSSGMIIVDHVWKILKENYPNEFCPKNNN